MATPSTPAVFCSVMHLAWPMSAGLSLYGCSSQQCLVLSPMIATGSTRSPEPGQAAGDSGTAFRLAGPETRAASLCALCQQWSSWAGTKSREIHGTADSDTTALKRIFRYHGHGARIRSVWPAWCCLAPYRLRWLLTGSASWPPLALPRACASLSLFARCVHARLALRSAPDLPSAPRATRPPLHARQPSAPRTARPGPGGPASRALTACWRGAGPS